MWFLFFTAFTGHKVLVQSRLSKPIEATGAFTIKSVSDCRSV